MKLKMEKIDSLIEKGACFKNSIRNFNTQFNFLKVNQQVFLVGDMAMIHLWFLLDCFFFPFALATQIRH